MATTALAHVTHRAVHEVATADALVPARDRCLPAHHVLASMLPDAGLPRGKVIGCSGPAGWSLALALAAGAVSAGSWLAIVGAPAVGLEAAAELGVSLSRVVLVDVEAGSSAGASLWAERVAAAADGFELIITVAPVGAERVVRRVRQRLQARGVVLLALASATPGAVPNVASDLDFTTSDVEWVGIQQGSGHLMARRAMVTLAGRRVPRPVHQTVLLPGPSGTLELLESQKPREYLGSA